MDVATLLRKKEEINLKINLLEKQNKKRILEKESIREELATYDVIFTDMTFSSVYEKFLKTFEDSKQNLEKEVLAAEEKLKALGL